MNYVVSVTTEAASKEELDLVKSNFHYFSRHNQTLFRFLVLWFELIIEDCMDKKIEKIRGNFDFIIDYRSRCFHFIFYSCRFRTRYLWQYNQHPNLLLPLRLMLFWKLSHPSLIKAWIILNRFSQIKNLLWC